MLVQSKRAMSIAAIVLLAITLRCVSVCTAALCDFRPLEAAEKTPPCHGKSESPAAPAESSGHPCASAAVVWLQAGDPQQQQTDGDSLSAAAIAVPAPALLLPATAQTLPRYPGGPPPQHAFASQHLPLRI